MELIFSGKLPLYSFLASKRIRILVSLSKAVFRPFGTRLWKWRSLTCLQFSNMTEPSTSERADRGRYRQDSQKKTISRERQNVQVQPQASQNNLMSIQQPTSTTSPSAKGFEHLTVQDKQRQPHAHAQPQASLSNLPQLGTGLTPDTARRGRKWFKMALPSYEPAMKATTEVAKNTLLPGSRSFTERETYSSLHGRRTAGSNLDVIIVTEFLIFPKDPATSFHRGCEENISRRYNDEVPIEYPRMTKREEKVYPGVTSKWSLFDSHCFVVCPTSSERCEFAVLQIELIGRVVCVSRLTSCVVHISEGQTSLTTIEHLYQFLL